MFRTVTKKVTYESDYTKLVIPVPHDLTLYNVTAEMSSIGYLTILVKHPWTLQEIIKIKIVDKVSDYTDLTVKDGLLVVYLKVI